MADILIRGLEMPKDGSLWLLIRPDGIVFKIKDNNKSGLPKEGTAVFLPEGHGKLGDLDKLEDAFIRYYLSQERSNHLVFTPVEIKQHFADMIADFPTIVPAEGGEHE